MKRWSFFSVLFLFFLLITFSYASGSFFDISEDGDTLISYVGNDTHVVIPTGILFIGDYAFDGCVNLTSVTIPSSVTVIGNGAFNGCTNLTNITIPSSVTYVGEGSFHGCVNLTSITIPYGVNIIAEGAFEGCIGLTSITIPSSVNKIGGGAFEGCIGLTNITIPSSVTRIEDNTFNGCIGLADITLPPNITVISENAFWGCENLSGITIPSSVTIIAEDAFRGCSSLNEITIPSEVTYIGDGAFWGCSGLTSITIPSSVTYIGQNAIPASTGSLAPYWYSKEDHKLYSPEEICGRTEIADTYLSERILKIFTENDQEIKRFYYSFGSLLGGGESGSVYSDIKYKMAVSNENSTITGSATLELPEGFSFDFNSVVTTLNIFINNGSFGSNGPGSITIYPTFLSENLKNSTLEFKISGCLEETLEIPVSEFAYQGKVYPSVTGGGKGSVDISLNPTEDFSVSMLSTFNDRLVRMGAALSFAAYNENYVKESLRNLGYLGAKTYSNSNNYSSLATDGIACGMGVRNIIEGNTIIHQMAIAVRGTMGQEWVGNGNVYSWKNILSERNEVHNSFQIAANSISGWVNEYCTDNDIPSSSQRIFATGHSRAAAVVDLYMNSLEPNKGTAYTFATPNSTKNPNENPNIFNILNKYDVVSYVPCSAKWGKYGNNYVFTTNEDDSHKKDHLMWIRLVYLGKEVLNKGDYIPFFKYLFEFKLLYNKFWKDWHDSKLFEHDPHSWETYWEAVENHSYQKCKWSDIYYEMDNFVGRLIQDIKNRGQMSEEEALAASLHSLGFDTENIVIDIECPVNTQIIDQNGNTAAVFQNHELLDFDDSTTLAFAEGDNDFAVLSDDRNYYVVITATDDGTMNVGMKRISKDLEVTSSTSRENIQITNGQRYILSYSPNVSLDNIVIFSEDDEFIIDSFGTLLAYTGHAPDVVIPNGVITIGAHAFQGNDDLQSVIIPAGVTAISEYAFAECHSLWSVTLPEGLITIGDRAFWDDYVLFSINIPDSVSEIGDEAFHLCTTICASEGSYAASWAIDNFRGLHYTGGGDFTIIDNVLYSYTGNASDVEIPAGVSQIAANAFANNQSVVSVTIPDGVYLLGWGAFTSCNNLTEISIPDSVTMISDYAFLGTNLHDIVLPANLTAINEGTFSYCGNLRSVRIPDTISLIGNGAFQYCDSLGNITIPDSVTVIGDGAFAGCAGIRHIILLDNIGNIGSGAFDQSTVIYAYPGSAAASWATGNGYSVSLLDPLDEAETFFVPAGVEAIGAEAFLKAASLQAVSIPNSVETIGDRAFADCVNLRSILIPQSVTSLGRDIFASIDYPMNIKIYASSNSPAAQWAEENGYILRNIN